MEYRGFELIRRQDGNAIRWHAYDVTGVRITSLGFKSAAALKRFLAERELRRIHTPKTA